MKNNYHIGCVVIFIVVAAIVCICLSRKYRQQREEERQELQNDTAKVNAAYRTYQRVHHQILMEDSDYAALYRENQSLKEEIKRLKGKVVLSP